MKALPALVVDVVAIVVFAIVGRSSHAEANTLLGVLATAWPFLVGAAVGHVICQLVRTLGADPIGWRAGAVVWASTLVVGVALRLVSGSTAAWSFVLVAGIVLAAFLVGWRVLVGLAQQARTRTGAAA